MDYYPKPVPVGVYRLSPDVDISAPSWLASAVQKGTAYIDRSLVDGAAKVYGCSIRGPTGKSQAKIGDYIIREPTGEIRVLKPAAFKALYERR